MRKLKRLSFTELVQANKTEILKNQKELEKIEKMIENKMLRKSN
ncbi:MAG: FbpB family small basic protein [Caldibacillus debilis]|jgi:hypothetical protein|uniref:FbpB family small basic protein n=2 Tax=Caldibacillus debilis TaxID=301148 RepID=A0A420VKE8_9BACI|nr:FbpB family small basic protein [Caldibacillus debilis]MBO2481771.1 FbpB family small basic protein [Bacillaceae bacterium]KYD07619.1 hypothetical protein B4135_4300 [Caldibacillus debilis]MBY6273151.1 FbpB family small basic protein [Bacillaceae bacterium]REJ18096.1 MAG: FbpB family small basic protein [Caldibacillus debilis]REJ27870.1 MAG: FbpB family small basic protein [Caldibacillus debilis]